MSFHFYFFREVFTLLSFLIKHPLLDTTNIKNLIEIIFHYNIPLQSVLGSLICSRMHFGKLISYSSQWIFCGSYFTKLLILMSITNSNCFRLELLLHPSILIVFNILPLSLSRCFALLKQKTCPSMIKLGIRCYKNK